MKRRGPICSGEQQTRQADVNKQGLATTTRTGAMPRMFTRRRFWLPALILVAPGSVLACFALQRRVTLREMLQVQMGMGKLEVQQILGRPDIIELESGQDHWLYRGSPESSEQRLPGQAFYWVVVFDAAGNELGWDDETRIDNSLTGSLETRLPAAKTEVFTFRSRATPTGSGVYVRLRLHSGADDSAAEPRGAAIQSRSGASTY